MWNHDVKFFSEKWDLRSCSLEEIMIAVVFCFQRMVSEIETQSSGIVAIIDVKDFALQQLRQFTPPLIKRITDIVQVKLNSKQDPA